MIKALAKPKCRNCGEKRAPAGTYFCSNKCARLWAEDAMLHKEEGWCGTCRQWARVNTALVVDGCQRCCGTLHFPQAEICGDPHWLPDYVRQAIELRDRTLLGDG